VLLLVVQELIIIKLPTKEQKKPDTFGISYWSKERFLNRISYPEMQSMDSDTLEERISLYTKEFVFVTLYSGADKDASTYTTVGFIASKSGHIIAHRGTMNHVDHASASFWSGEQTFDATVISVDDATGMMILRMDSWNDHPSWDQDTICIHAPKNETPDTLAIECENAKNADTPILKAVQNSSEAYSIPLLEYEAPYSVFVTKGGDPSEMGDAVLFDGGYLVGFEIPSSLVGQSDEHSAEPLRYWLGPDAINELAIDIASKNDPTYPGIGITVHALEAGEVSSNRAQEGLYIDAVIDGSPAAINGIRAGDIMISCDRWQVNELEDLTYFFWQDATVGDYYKYKIDRDGQILDFSIETGMRGDYFPNENK
jgi:S1-C subfamily serine protease